LGENGKYQLSQEIFGFFLDFLSHFKEGKQWIENKGATHGYICP